MKLAAFVFGAVPLIIQFYAKKYLEEDKVATLTELENDLNLPRIKEYDFIVVGAGPTGCVIASRLSEQFNVLLLEAGGPPPPSSHVPFYVLDTAFDPDINYFWPNVPQRYASLDTGGVIVSHLGKMLGGSDSHNDMVHNRGSPHDYDNFARILNDSSWSYANVLQYFKKELGYQIGDPNGYQKESFTPMAKAINKGQRSSAYKSYIEPIKNSRQNLTVLPYSLVTQVLIDDNKIAYGVVYERHGIPQIAHASKEVIISSGIFASPLLLMKSGVGPRDQLEEAGIPVKHEQPAIGQNLGEHLFFTITNIQFNSSFLPYAPRMPQGKELEEMFQKYQQTGEGIMGYLQEGPEAFLVSSRAKQDGQGDWPDILMVFDAMCPATTEDEPVSACMYVYPGRLKMRGTVKLNATEYKSGNENDLVKLAIIDHAIFEGEGASDMDVVLDGIDAMMSVLNSTTMRKFDTVLKEEPHPACGAYEYLSREYWRCVVSRRVNLGLHGVGTCSLGTVLDTKFRVQGISGLRVADASVFPTTPNANLMAPILMMAEKASDDIKQSWM
ncbi:Oxygen-dependent choline dehydrogenase [Orchesella cincta]|uniref:Oxygen-dependent choline dehydrogenase n=1 Tax=Orchesella cincta TaxID=48709 RepID=A0A1D2M672_ORCCI|nr:Oxygen-dependent choline dehydrogenase [Orchesella cincta]